MTNTEYYSKRTVSELRAMLTVAGIQTSSRTRKPDLVTYVVNMLDDAHESAIEQKNNQVQLDQINAWVTRHGGWKGDANDTAAFILSLVAIDYDEATALNTPVTVAKAMWMIYEGIGNGKRTQNYVRQNGSHKLTARQNRRITKKGNREYGYSTKNLQVVSHA